MKELFLLVRLSGTMVVMVQVTTKYRNSTNVEEDLVVKIMFRQILADLSNSLGENILCFAYVCESLLVCTNHWP